MKTSSLSTDALVALANTRDGSVNGNRHNAVRRELLRRGIYTVADYYTAPLIAWCAFCAPDEACALHVGTVTA